MSLPGDSYGRLIVDSGTRAGDGTDRKGAPTELPALGAGSVASTEVSGADLWATGGAAFRTRWVGAWMGLEDGSGGDLGTFQVLEIDGTGRVLLAGAGTVIGAASYQGEYRFDEIELHNSARLNASDNVTAGDTTVFAGEAGLPTVLTSQNLTLKTGSMVTDAGWLAETFPSPSMMVLTVPGTLTVETGAVLDLTGRGYRGGTNDDTDGAPAPDLVMGSDRDTGGSHGGAGVAGDGLGPSGEIYDSVYAPSLAGGGGAYDNGTGRAGGGGLSLEAGDLVLEGEILSRGADTSFPGAPGAGGTVLVTAGTVQGAGLIDVSGGDYTSCSGNVGAGGGGRAALFADLFDGFDPETQVLAWGGENTCADTSSSLRIGLPGTVYVLEPGDTFGR